MLLLTDGQGNVGIVDFASLVALAPVTARDGVGTTTIGFGDDFNEELLSVQPPREASRSHENHPANSTRPMGARLLQRAQVST